MKKILKDIAKYIEREIII